MKRLVKKIADGLTNLPTQPGRRACSRWQCHNHWSPPYIGWNQTRAPAWGRTAGRWGTPGSHQWAAGRSRSTSTPPTGYVGLRLSPGRSLGHQEVLPWGMSVAEKQEVVSLSTCFLGWKHIAPRKLLPLVSLTKELDQGTDSPKVTTTGLTHQGVGPGVWLPERYYHWSHSPRSWTRGLTPRTLLPLVSLTKELDWLPKSYYHWSHSPRSWTRGLTPQKLLPLVSLTKELDWLPKSYDHWSHSPRSWTDSPKVTTTGLTHQGVGLTPRKLLPLVSLTKELDWLPKCYYHWSNSPGCGL